MKLTWHIVLKDLRRLWPWLALLVGATLTRYALGWHLEHHPRPGPILLERSAIAEGILLGLQLLIGALFAAQVIHEDTTNSDRAFWVTRPISGLKLLAAKILTLLATLGLLPLLAVLGWWFLHDFRACEIAAALPEFTVRQSALIAASFGVAVFTRTTTGFILTAIATVIVLWIQTNIYARWTTPEPPPSIVGTHAALYLILAAAAIIACAYLKYTRRRSLAPRVILFSTVLTGNAIGAFWIADLTPLVNPGPQEPAIASPITIRPFASPELSKNAAATFFAFSHIPPDHLLDIRHISTRLIGKDASRPIAFSSLGLSPIHTATAQQTHDPRRAPTQYAYRFSFAPFSVTAIELTPHIIIRRVETVAELPLELGASQQTGPYRTRITAISSHSTYRSVNLLSVLPAHLCSPGTGLSEPQSNLLLSTGVSRKPFRTRRIFLTGNHRLPLDHATQQWSLQIDQVRHVLDNFHYTPIADADPALDRLVHATYPLLGEFKRTLTTTVALP